MPVAPLVGHLREAESTNYRRARGGVSSGRRFLVDRERSARTRLSAWGLTGYPMAIAARDSVTDEREHDRECCMDIRHGSRRACGRTPAPREQLAAFKLL